MRSNGSRAFAAAVFAVLLVTVCGVPVADASEGITLETSLGSVTCTADPAQEPGPEAISATPFAHGLIVTVEETGALRCQIPGFGDVEATGAGLPWRLSLNEQRGTARLRGNRLLGLLIHPVALPSLSCLYQAGRSLGTLTAGSSPAVSISVPRVRLDRRQSNKLCPALPPMSLNVTLP